MSAQPLSAQWKLTVDRRACIGSGLCVGTAPWYFQLGPDRRSHPVSSLIDSDQKVLDAAMSCPTEAITVIESGSERSLFPEDGPDVLPTDPTHPATVRSMSYPRRRAALRERLRALELDALLVTDLLNLRYLTGFTGSHGALLVHAESDERSVFATDGRYRTQSQQQVPDLRRVIDRSIRSRLAKDATEEGTARLGFESHVMTVDGHAALAKVTGAEVLVAISRPVEALRLIKDETEIAALRAACAAADTALAGLLAEGGLRPGRTEREVARGLEARMVAAGATGPSFETIVATGANSAVPHHRPTDAQLCRGDLLKMDFGALVEGYHSDMTRTVVLGAPAGWQRELYDLVAAAQAAGRVALRAGADVRDVDAAARDVITHAGHGEDFVHGLGHGVGLQIHEAPALSQFGVGTLATGMAVTVEPGVYLAGRGGVRIEDTLIVSDGDPELLTLTTKDLVVVPC